LTKEKIYKVAVIAPTCFYYQVDLFRQLAGHPRIDLTVYFCSKEALESKDVKGMYGTDQNWGNQDELLEGYEYQFLTNFSPRPSYLRSFYGLINLGVINRLLFNRPDAVILMSWMNPTWWLSILFAVALRIPIFYLTDANFQTERGRSGIKIRVKSWLLGHFIFKLTSGFLCAGIANEELYRLYGVGDDKLFPFAYSWGYEQQIEMAKELLLNRDKIRSELSIQPDDLAILFCGRLSEEKQPFFLLEAYRRLDHPRKKLIIVGDGELREALVKKIAADRILGVHFAGFQDRHALGSFYASADFLVLPSSRDTWGMVVAEAMCYRMPIIVSNHVGAGEHLVLDGENGHKFTAGSVDELSAVMQKLADDSIERRKEMGDRSLRLISEWNERDVASHMDEYIAAVGGD